MGTVNHIRLRPVIQVLLVALLVAGSVRAEGVGESRVRKDLARFIRARMADTSATIEIPRLAVFSVDRKRHPGALRTEFSSNSKTPYSGRVSVTVSLFAGGELIKKSVISPYIKTMAPAVVAGHDLRRGDVLAADDLMIVDRDEGRMPNDTIGEISQAIGLRMKRSVREGAVLRQNQVEGVPVVERGERVTLILRSGLIEIQAIGRSQEAGVAGDWIRVVNLDSKREISGRVDRNGLVHVAF